MGSLPPIRFLTPFVADVISYGYAFVVIAAALQFDIRFSMLEAILVMVLFVLMRAAAREIARLHRVAARRRVI